MSTLSLGVVNVAYVDSEEKDATTTGEVAEILEDKYHVMGVFVDTHKEEIADLVAKKYLAMLNTMVNNGPKPDSKAIPMDRVDSAFRDYLGADEWQHSTGQTIAAARAGVSHRFKSVKGGTLSAASIASGKNKAASIALKKSRGPRPAFIDTGLYSAAFRSWLTF
jgi:hypothetical protein